MTGHPASLIFGPLSIADILKGRSQYLKRVKVDLAEWPPLAQSGHSKHGLRPVRDVLRD